MKPDRTPERIDRIINQLRDVWKTAPELRLGQMILNTFSEQTLYYVEDQELVDKLAKRLGGGE